MARTIVKTGLDEPSHAAVAAVSAVGAEAKVSERGHELLMEALKAAHHPSLGIERSVCFRAAIEEVVGLLRDLAGPQNGDGHSRRVSVTALADGIEEHYGID